MTDARRDSRRDSRWKTWGLAAVDKGIKVSDWFGGYANAGAAKIGAERFWPVSGDMALEIDKCTRILRAFTVEGIAEEKEVNEKTSEGWITKKRKVFKKIPPDVIKSAKGIAIFSAMRSGIAPFGGAGGGGVVVGRLPDGSWSAPSAILPNNLSAGFMIGLDFYDAILVLRTQKALDSFRTHKLTVGSEIGVAAGPFGAGASGEMGIERAPIFSYLRSRGLYAGAEIMGQVFVDRFDENERFYYWPGIKAGDILSGKVRIPPEAAILHRALRDAESGSAQGDTLEYDDPVPGDRVTPDMVGSLDLGDGETLRLPPTPAELERAERAGYRDEEDERLERLEREAVWKMPKPPRHWSVLAKAKGSRRVAPEWRFSEPVQRNTSGMGGDEKGEIDPAKIPLPPSPVDSMFSDKSASPYRSLLNSPRGVSSPECASEPNTPLYALSTPSPPPAPAPAPPLPPRRSLPPQCREVEEVPRSEHEYQRGAEDKAEKEDEKETFDHAYDGAVLEDVDLGDASGPARRSGERDEHGRSGQRDSVGVGAAL